MKEEKINGMKPIEAVGTRIRTFRTNAAVLPLILSARLLFPRILSSPQWDVHLAHLIALHITYGDTRHFVWQLLMFLFNELSTILRMNLRPN